MQKLKFKELKVDNWPGLERRRPIGPQGREAGRRGRRGRASTQARHFHNNKNLKLGRKVIRMENNFESAMNFGDKVKAWLEDNLRVLLSVLIVVAIAGGIYSYSQRTQSPTVTDTTSTEAVEGSAESIGEGIAESGAGESATDAQKQADAEAAKGKQVTSAETSRETETSFIETAQAGDGSTHLARRALANYLEKNPDSALTKEHKIFIEDYLRKTTASKGAVKTGASMEFSKDAVKGAIEKSKQLNDAQLNNLKKFSARVSSI
jgi:hypothetical protein